MGTQERGTTRPVSTSTNMEARRDAVKTFIAVAIFGFILLGIAVSTVMNIWFKYDAPHEYKWQDDDRD